MDHIEKSSTDKDQRIKYLEAEVAMLRRYVGDERCQSDYKTAGEMRADLESTQKMLSAVVLDILTHKRRAQRIVELTNRITPGNAVHHARNIGTIAGAIADWKPSIPPIIIVRQGPKNG